MQDVISVYMSTKKNAKCMTLLMIKDEYKSRVGQLAEAAAARVLRREVGSLAYPRSIGRVVIFPYYGLGW